MRPAAGAVPPVRVPRSAPGPNILRTGIRKAVDAEVPVEQVLRDATRPTSRQVC